MELRIPLRWLAILFVLLAAGLLAACGGNGDDGEVVGDETPDAAAPATPEEPAATAAIATEEPGGEAGAAPADALADLESYRVDLRFTLEGTVTEGAGLLAVDLEGAFVAPDRTQTRVTARVDELELEEESITIGGQSWVKVGDDWVEGEPQFEFGDISPSSLLENLSAEQLRLIKPSKETVNGVESLRYSIGRDDIDALRSVGALFGGDETLADMPEDFDIDLWLAEDGGWPVRITMTAHGMISEGEEIDLDFSMDITDVNDPDVKIEVPEG